MKPFRRLSHSVKLDHLFYITGFLGIIGAIFVYQRPPFFDEKAYLQDVASLQLYGFGNKYLLHLIGSAGPLYSSVHYLVSPLTSLKVPAIRLVNVAFLTGIVIFSSALFRKLKYIRSDYALCIMAIPMIYVVAGLALTEIPAMFFFSAGIYFIIGATMNNDYDSLSITKLIFGGILLSLSIIGRQPYLVTLFALPILFYDKRLVHKAIGGLLITLLCALAIPLYIFYTWKGLVPPIDAMTYIDIAKQGVNYRLDYFCLCLAYFSMIFWIICPGFFRFPSVKQGITLLFCLIVVEILNAKYHFILYLPARSLLSRLIISDDLIPQAEIHFGSFLCLLGIMFILKLVKRLSDISYNKQLCFFTLALLAIAFSCVKITWGFSSRYAAQAIPLILPVAGYFFERDRYFRFRICAGILAGLLALYFYYCG